MFAAASSKRPDDTRPNCFRVKRSGMGNSLTSLSLPRPGLSIQSMFFDTRLLVLGGSVASVPPLDVRPRKHAPRMAHPVLLWPVLRANARPGLRLYWRGVTAVKSLALFAAIGAVALSAGGTKTANAATPDFDFTITGFFGRHPTGDTVTGEIDGLRQHHWPSFRCYSFLRSQFVLSFLIYSHFDLSGREGRDYGWSCDIFPRVSIHAVTRRPPSLRHRPRRDVCSVGAGSANRA